MNTTRSDYKGYCITTRWHEVHLLAGMATAQFDACFEVDSRMPHEDSWQEFPVGVFRTRQDAIENALAKAKRSIDLALTTG